MQDVFVRVYRALRASERPVSLRAWLYRIAHNRCIDHLRGPQPCVADVFDMSRTPQPDPPTVAERREDLQRLVTDVRRLPEQQRSALLMRELQGMSYEELAVSLDVTVAAVKSLLVRARSGLVDSAAARDTACTSVRHDLALSCDRGVRSSGLARRHLRDCSACREYRDDLRGVQRRFGALVPVGPLGLLCQVGGLGGGGAAAGGSVGAGVGASGAILTATKVALVCAAAAVTAGGALEIAPKTLLHAFHDAPPASASRHSAPSTRASAGAASWPRRSWSCPLSRRVRRSARPPRPHHVHPPAPRSSRQPDPHDAPVAPLGGSAVARPPAPATPCRPPAARARVILEPGAVRHHGRDGQLARDPDQRDEHARRLHRRDEQGHHGRRERDRVVAELADRLVGHADHEPDERLDAGGLGRTRPPRRRARRRPPVRRAPARAPPAPRARAPRRRAATPARRRRPPPSLVASVLAPAPGSRPRRRPGPAGSEHDRQVAQTYANRAWQPAVALENGPPHR